MSVWIYFDGYVLCLFCKQCCIPRLVNSCNAVAVSGELKCYILIARLQWVPVRLFKFVDLLPSGGDSFNCMWCRIQTTWGQHFNSVKNWALYQNFHCAVHAGFTLHNRKNEGCHSLRKESEEVDHKYSYLTVKKKSTLKKRSNMVKIIHTPPLKFGKISLSKLPVAATIFHFILLYM